MQFPFDDELRGEKQFCLRKFSTILMITKRKKLPGAVILSHLLIAQGENISLHGYANLRHWFTLPTGGQYLQSSTDHNRFYLKANVQKSTDGRASIGPLIS